MSPTRSALLLARLRAEESVPAADVAGTDLAADAAAVGRRLVRVGSAVRLGWADGHEPHPDGAPTARLSAFPTGLLAAVLALAWRDAAANPYPGEPLPTGAVEQLAAILDRSPNVVTKYLAELRAAELIAEGDDGRLHLGPAVATWTSSAVNALRRHHDLLAAVLGGLR
jgi:hypothetical protein